MQYRLIRVNPMGKGVMVSWEKGNRYIARMMRLQVVGPRDGILAMVNLDSQDARKIARALLRAAHEMEERPKLRLVKSRGRRSR